MEETTELRLKLTIIQCEKCFEETVFLDRRDLNVLKVALKIISNLLEFIESQPSFGKAEIAESQAFSSEKKPEKSDATIETSEEFVEDVSNKESRQYLEEIFNKEKLLLKIKKIKDKKKLSKIYNRLLSELKLEKEESSKDDALKSITEIIKEINDENELVYISTVILKLMGEDLSQAQYENIKNLKNLRK